MGLELFYICYKMFKPQYSIDLMNCAFVRFWYTFIFFFLEFKTRVNGYIYDHSMIMIRFID